MKELHDLETYEVSLVPKGANGKQFLVFKSLKGQQGMKDAKEIVEWITKNVDKETMKKVEAVIKGLDGASEQPADEAPLDDKTKAALQAIARIASPMKDSLHPGHLVKVLQAAGYDMSKGMAGPEAEPAEGSDLEKEQQAIPEDILSDMKDVLKSRMAKEEAEDEEMEKALKADMDGACDEAGKAYKAHLEKLGYRKYPDAQIQMKSMARKDLPKQVDVSEENHEHGEAQPMDVTKSLDLSKVDPKVKTALEAIFKGQKDLIEKADKLEKDNETLREAARDKEFTEKAAKIDIGAKTEDLAKILKALPAEQCAALEAILGGAGEAVKKSKLFEEIGSGAGSKIAGDDAYAKLERMAEGMVEKSAGKVSKADAMDAVLKTTAGAELYKEYMAQKPGMKV